MLALTPTAAQAVETIVSGANLPDSAGLRISTAPMAENSAGPQPQLRLDVVPEPAPEDASIEGAPLYVEPDTADYLQDKVLDAEIEESQVHFTLHERAQS